MHPHSAESSSECMCSLHTQEATGWEERSLWQQMWNYVAELTSKLFDSGETDPQCSSNQCVKHLNNLLLHCPVCPCVLRATSASRTAGSCCLKPLSSRFIKQHRFSSAAASLPQQHKRRCWTGCKVSPAQDWQPPNIWFSSALKELEM